MVLCETLKEIVEDRASEVSFVPGFLGRNKGVKRKVTGPLTQQLFSDLYQRTCDKLGSPTSIHSDYGFMWETAEGILAYGVIEEGLHEESLSFFLFDRCPRAKKLTFAAYTQTVEAVRRVFSDHGFSFISSMIAMYYAQETFTFVGEDKDTQCHLTIKRRALTFARLHKRPLGNGMTKYTPYHLRKKRLSSLDVASIKQAVESCFAVE